MIDPRSPRRRKGAVGCDGRPEYRSTARESTTVRPTGAVPDGIVSHRGRRRIVEGRVYVRSWNDRPTGWYCAFLAQPLGSIHLAGREISVCARRPRGARMRNAVTEAYAAKYTTTAPEYWVKGFAEPNRLATTLELMPLEPAPGMPGSWPDIRDERFGSLNWRRAGSLILEGLRLACSGGG